MKKFMLWLFRRSALSLAGWIVTPVITVVAIFFRSQLLASWEFLQGAPGIVWGAVFLGPLTLLLLSISILVKYLCRTDDHHITPRYLRIWDRLPYRRVLIVGPYLSAGRMQGVYRLPMISFEVTVRRGRNLLLKEGFLENLLTGERENFLFCSTGSSTSLSEFKYLRKNVRTTVHLQQFDLTKEEFIDKWGGFRVVLTCDDWMFEREFSRSDVVKRLGDSWQRFHLPSP